MHNSLARPVLPFSDPDLVTIGWNERAVGPKDQPLYAGGYCGQCSAPIGARTGQPVRLSRTPKADVCGFGQRVSRQHFVSDVILSALSATEIDAIGPRPVVFEKASATRRAFFEVAGVPRLSQVGVRGGTYWRLASVDCAACGYRAFACSHPALEDTARASDFIARSDLPDDPASAFLVEDSLGRVRIGMSYARFGALASRLPGVALWPSRLFCLDEAAVERHPTLEA